MQIITRPHRPDARRHIITEGINYFSTGKRSIWGKGDKETLILLRRAKIHGRWLNLAAGDGRYNMLLLRKADSVVATDVDESALSKLWHYTPKEYRHRLSVEAFNATKRLPFGNGSFDGVFCAGTLHLFPPRVVERMASEMDRVLKPGGRAIIDFAVDLKRTALSGKPREVGRKGLYTMDEGKRLLKHLFADYDIAMKEGRVVEDVEGGVPYVLNCRFILLVADKKG